MFGFDCVAAGARVQWRRLRMIDDGCCACLLAVCGNTSASSVTGGYSASDDGSSSRSLAGGNGLLSSAAVPHLASVSPEEQAELAADVARCASRLLHGATATQQQHHSTASTTARTATDLSSSDIQLPDQNSGLGVPTLISAKPLPLNHSDVPVLLLPSGAASRKHDQQSDSSRQQQQQHQQEPHDTSKGGFYFNPFAGGLGSSSSHATGIYNDSA